MVSYAFLASLKELAAGNKAAFLEHSAHCRVFRVRVTTQVVNAVFTAAVCDELDNFSAYAFAFLLSADGYPVQSRILIVIQPSAAKQRSVAAFFRKIADKYGKNLSVFNGDIANSVVNVSENIVVIGPSVQPLRNVRRAEISPRLTVQLQYRLHIGVGRFTDLHILTSLPECIFMITNFYEHFKRG